MTIIKSKTCPPNDSIPPAPVFSDTSGWEIFNSNFISQLANQLFREDVPHTAETVPHSAVTEESQTTVAKTRAKESDILPEEFTSSGNTPEDFARMRGQNFSTIQEAPGIVQPTDFLTYNKSEPEQTGVSDKTIEAKPAKESASASSAGYDYYFLHDSPPKTGSEKESSSSDATHDSLRVRKDFPLLQQTVHGKPLIWLDNAATTQKPQIVLDTLDQYYREYNSNVHRGSHTLANRATAAFEEAREKAQQFIGASSNEEIIFVRGATEGINLVTQTYGRMKVFPGDEILLTHMEHHSNIVPWQFLRKERNAVIKVIPINDRGEILLGEYEKMLSSRVRIVALTHVSNVLGTVNPLRLMIEMAHDYGACVLVDGAQAVPHFQVDVKDLNADFYSFSGHKLYGPTGIGVLYGKKALLEEMPPWQGGGSMIHEVTLNETTFNRLPFKFEAGTGNIADAIGLGAAIDYIQNKGLANIERHTRELTGYAMESISRVPGLCLIGTAPNKVSSIAFIMGGLSPEEIAHHLDQEGIAVRSGHHCAQPLLQRFGVKSTVRASLAMYNTREEVDCLVSVLTRLAKNHC